MSKNYKIDFLKSDVDLPIKAQSNFDTYKILIADDDIEVHTVTKMVLQDFVFNQYRLEFLDAYTGEETKSVLAQYPDIAVVFLDVVMEKFHSGLEVVKYLREDLNNAFTRIILRTGQPGEAPEESIIRDYDINDYRLKTDMTVQRIKTSLYVALRNYRDLIKIENNRKGLEKIITASSNLFSNQSIDQLFKNILNQLSTFNSHDSEILYIQDVEKPIDAFITQQSNLHPMIIIGTGRFEKCIGLDMNELQELQTISEWIHNHKSSPNQVAMIDNGIIISQNSSALMNNYIYIDTKDKELDINLVNVFMSHYSVALENYLLSNMINTTQTEIISTFADTVEKHFDETGSHVERISKMMYQFALKMYFSYAECETLKVASTMHDIGKISIPDSILKKPGKLTPEEYEIIKNHSRIGYNILSKSDLGILKIAAEIAFYHHEKYDGTGYPNGLKGNEIPLNARMMAIIDVFDAITHKRIYKESESVEVALSFLVENKGIHFDPNLVDLFINNYDEIIQGTLN